MAASAQDFPPFTTVRYHFYRWRDCGLLALINGSLVAASRLVEGREAEPTAAIIDSRSGEDDRKWSHHRL